MGSEKPAGFSGPFFHAKDRNRQMMPFFFMILSVKNAMPDSPQAVRHCSYKNKNSAVHGQSKAEAI
ncbi:MAG: hypothetical protein ACLU9R_02260 [Faecalibacterium sp.]